MKNKEKQKIYLIRHAKPDLPHNGKLYYGSTDYPLSEEGVKMAKRLADSLRAIEVDAVFSSDLVRAKETAEIVLAGRSCEIRPVRGLREIHLGDC